MNKKVYSLSIRYLQYIFLASLIGCVDPIEPEFEFKEGTVYVDAFVSTSLGASSVVISEWVLESDELANEFISGANVLFRNADTNLEVMLTEQEGAYLPPEDFAASVGDLWELLITLPSGKQYRSLPEEVTRPVDFSNIRATYNPQLTFRESSNTFIPGHSISIDVNDPTDEENFYYWRFRSYEKIRICETCFNSVLRNGKCEENESYQNPPSTGYEFDYLCETADCWQIRYTENIKIFSDEFTNGTILNALPVADVILYTKTNILVEVQQFSLSAPAYEYYRILKDIVENNGSFNAPPPAALIGNLFNPDDDQEFVLGRFTVASTTMRSIFIERSNIPENPIDPESLAQLECCGLGCIPLPLVPGVGCIAVNFTTCEETRFRTSNMPEGWVE